MTPQSVRRPLYKVNVLAIILRVLSYVFDFWLQWFVRVTDNEYSQNDI